MDYNVITDKTNIEIYQKYRIRRSNELRHRCVLCGEVTSVDGSISNQGARLICNRCVERKFDTRGKALRWVEGGNRD